MSDEALLRAAVDAAGRLNRGVLTRWGSVDEHDAPMNQLQVTVDGDDDPTPVTNATPAIFTPGQRVMVMFTPPQGAHVIGYRPAVATAYTPELDGVDLDDGSVTGEWICDGTMVDFAVTVALGAAGSMTGTIGVGLPMEGTGLGADGWLVVARATIGTDRFTGSVQYDPTDPWRVAGFGSDGMGLWGATTPATWGPGDVLRVSGRYPRRLPIQNVDDE